MSRLQEWIDEFQGDPDYEFAKVAIDVGEQIVARMEEQGLTQADLARKMDVSRARVSQILRGSDNLTLKSIVTVGIGLDARVDLQLKPASPVRQFKPTRTVGRPVRSNYRSVAPARPPRIVEVGQEFAPAIAA